jgi:hypothetical protein
MRYQKRMLFAARTEKFWPLYLFAVLLSLAALVAGVYSVNLWAVQGRWPPDGIAVFGLASALIIFTIVYTQRFDPNADDEIRQRSGKPQPYPLAFRNPPSP